MDGVASRSSAFEIREGDLDSPEVQALLREHLASVALYSPPESFHALDLDGLRAPEVTFWSVWSHGEGASQDKSVLVGCGALKELDPRHGEIKSMRTASSHLRKGVGGAMVRHIIAVARRRGYARLSLETGSMAAFAPARALYTRFGFTPCPPFADYTDDSNSTFMTLEPA